MLTYNKLLTILSKKSVKEQNILMYISLWNSIFYVIRFIIINIPIPVYCYEIIVMASAVTKYRFLTF